MPASRWDENRQRVERTHGRQGPMPAKALWARGFSALVLLLALLALFAGALTYVLSRDLYRNDDGTSSRVPAKATPSPPAVAIAPPQQSPVLAVGTPEASPSGVSAAEAEKTFSRSLSQKLTRYLHRHRLPHVDAGVYVDSSKSPSHVELTGQVCAEGGKQDAESKSEKCLGVESLEFKNEIELDPTLCSASEPSPSAEQGSGDGGTPPPSLRPPPSSCVQLCQSDKNNCTAKCVQSAASSWIPGLPKLPWGGDTVACNSQCQNDFDHCRVNCDQGGGGSPEGGPPPG